MGLGNFLKKLSGGDAKTGNAFTFVLGADKHFRRRNLESQGSHIQDNEYRLAHFSSPDANGVLSKVVNGQTRIMGPVCVAYEPITELFWFSNLDWGKDRAAVEAQEGGNGQNPTYEHDEILDNSWAEGFSLADQRDNNQETRNRLMQILLLAVLLAGGLFLLVAAATGLLGDFIANAGKFFGG